MNKKINVLMVDDSELILSRVKGLLSSVQAIETMETTTTIEKAKLIIETKKPDVIILDVHFPEGNGILFLKALKQKCPEIMVVMFTNLADSYFKATAEKYGADYFLDKSLEYNQLSKILLNKYFFQNENLN